MEKGPLLSSPARVGKSTAAARARRWQLLGFAAFTSSCFSGTLIGWAGVTAALQSDAPGGGGLSEDEARRLFFYSSSVSMAASIPAGLVLDILGARACFCAANALCALGLGLFSLGPHMAGLNTFAVGSIGQMSSLMHVAALFAPHEATVMAASSTKSRLGFLNKKQRYVCTLLFHLGGFSTTAPSALGGVKGPSSRMQSRKR